MDSTFTHLPYKYFAFISYNSHDIKWGKRLQKKLEHYRMPATLCSERGWVRTPIKPVFFAPTDIQPGGLSQELQALTRIEQGWTYGPARNDQLKQHPCLVPYDELPESEKEYDRCTAVETLKTLSALGWKLVKTEE